MTTNRQDDPAMIADLKALTDRVHDLLRAAQDDGEPFDTIQLKIPRAWLLLAAWMQLAERDRATGRFGPVAVSVPGLHDRALRTLAKKWLRSHVEEEMQLHLHYLSVGNHPFLLPLSAEMPESKRALNGLPTGEGLPF